MKHAVAMIVLGSFVSGCAIAPKYTCDEECSLYEMTCRGLTTGVSGGEGVSTTGHAVFYSGASRAVSCEKPKDEQERDEIKTLQASAEEKRNKAKVESDKRNAVIVVLSLIAGVIATLILTNQ